MSMVKPVVLLAPTCLLLVVLPLLLHAMAADAGRAPAPKSQAELDSIKYHQREYGVSSSEELHQLIAWMEPAVIQHVADLPFGGGYSGMVTWLDGQFGTVISRASHNHKFRLSCPAPGKWSEHKCTHNGQRKAEGGREETNNNTTVASRVCVALCV